MSTTPATRFAAVIVSVLSKQQTTTLSAGDVRKGSVQKIEYFCNATKLASTAKLSSISSSSGGTTLVMFIMQSRSLLFPRPHSIPFTLTYQLMEIAKIRRNPMKRKDSTAASKLCYYKYSKCCNKSTTICVNFAAIAVSLIIYICTVMLQLL